MRVLPHLKLTGKIVLLVMLLGALAISITLYSLNSLYNVDQSYRALLDNEAQASLLLGAAQLDLSDSSHLVLSVLTQQTTERMRSTQQVVREQQLKFRAKLAEASPLLKDSNDVLTAIQAQEHQLFTLAHGIIDAAAQWRGDRALNIIEQEFNPAQQQLRDDLQQLRSATVKDFQARSQALNDTTRRTLITSSSAFGLSLILVLALAAHFSLRQISRPILQLTQAMRRLSRHDYTGTINHADRQDEVGQMARALQVFRDTMLRADQLEREAAANLETQRLSQQLIDLTQAMPGAAFQLRIEANGEQTFTFLSDKAEALVGQPVLSAEHCVLRLDHIRTMSNDARTAELDQQLKHSCANLVPLDVDMQVEHAGRRFWLKTLANVRLTEDNAVLFNGIWLDITHAKAQALALEDAKDQAEQAANDQALFLTTMSHEIRTPMNAILGLAQLCLKGQLTPQQQDRIEKILRSGEHLLAIINDILDFSKIDGGHLQPEKIPFSAQELLEDTYTMLEAAAADKGLLLQIADTSALPTLIGDPLRISQILLNFANNAIKFSEQGQITLRLQLQQEEDGDEYLYGEVEDQGMGLDGQQQHRLFQPFQQGDSSITRRFGGTGLGLAISRNIAELLGGTVGVRSVLGEGSTFWFRIKIDTATNNGPASIKTPWASDPIEKLSRLRVLLVDDNELNRLVIGDLLKETGMSVTQAVNGKEAINLLERSADGYFDAVLMDIMMPEMDGLAATRWLRKNPRFSQLPIIAMTAKARSADAAECLSAGMSAHLAKPILESDLHQVLLACCCAGQNAAAMPPHISKSRENAPIATLDIGPLTNLQRISPPERFNELLHVLLKDCQHRADAFQQLAEHPDRQALDKQAHDLSSTTGQLGFDRLHALIQELRNQLANPEEALPHHLSQTIVQEIHAAMDAVQQHFKPRY